MKATRFLPVALLFALPACSGGGSGTTATSVTGGGTGGQAPQSGSVTPTFTFVLPGSASANAAKRAPKFLGAGSKGVVITLVSSTAGLSNVSVATDLTANGICTGTPKTCTVAGPPVPPGTDTFSVATYDMSPTGSPLTEPANAKVLAQTGSTAAPTIANPSFTVNSGAANSLSITLYGLPAAALLTASPSGTPGTPIAATNFGLTVEDASGDTITGQFAAPVTVTDNDSADGGSQGTQIAVSGGTAGLTQALNDDTDSGGVTYSYGGLAEVSPTITFASSGATLASSTFTIGASTIVLTPSEVDLYNANVNQSGNTGTFVASETGWTNSPYDKTLVVTPIACSSGTAASVYSLGSTTGTTFTDTVPSSAPLPGICTVSVGGDNQGNTAIETLTYTTSPITVDAKRRK